MSSLKSILNQKSYGIFIQGVNKNKIPYMIRVAGEWTNKRAAQRELSQMLSLDSRKLKGEVCIL